MPIAIVTENDDLTGPAEFEADVGHVEAGLSRLIERWKADTRPNMGKLLAPLLEECQELENAIWSVIYGRTIDYAEGEQLDMLGRIVGQPRNGLDDDAYRAHVNARIRINRSFGTSNDVIAVIRLIDSAAFHLTEGERASFLVYFDEPPSNAGIGRELGNLIKQARAAGVAGLVTMPVDRDEGRGAFFGSVYDPPLNAARGWSSVYDTTVGGLFGHAKRA